MSAQVEQVKHSNDQVPARTVQSGQLFRILFNNNRMPPILRGSLWDTSIGNTDHEYRQRRRHRYRLPKNTWALHHSRPRARNRLRTLVTLT